MYSSIKTKDKKNNTASLVLTLMWCHASSRTYKGFNRELGWGAGRVFKVLRFQ